MTTDIVTKTNTEISNYKPVESLQSMAVAEVAEKHYRRAKDMDGLHNAIEVIWTERDGFVRWWDAQDKDKGGGTYLTDNRPVKGEKLDDFNLSSMSVSRWRQKCGDDVGVVIEQQYAKALKIIDPDAQHVHVGENSGENEWYTPSKYIEAARRVMGSIDLDPASCTLANETVKATTFYSAEDSGLDKEWAGNVWMNPPYAQPLISDFTKKILSEYDNIKSACILVNNATDTQWLQSLIVVADAVCFISGRVKFIDSEGNPGAPLQGQVIVYFGENTVGFKNEFSVFGVVLTGE